MRQRLVQLSGDEYDAFSRRARRMLRWKRGEVKNIKAKFWRRFRRKVKTQAAREE